jgi:hypothetical protein
MRVLLLAFLALSVPAVTAASPDDEQNGPSSPPQRSSPDFLFGRPDGSVSLRGSWVFSRAGSDWYDFVTRHLTLEDSDFNAPAIGADVGIALTPRLELIGGVDFTQSETSSEYRDFVDNFRQPIEQRTRLREVNLSGGLKVALTERGREIGRFAWVPRRFVPYVGAGGGMLWFEMRQVGDFVDFVDNSIFADAFQSRGWTPSAHVFGGVDIKLVRRLYLTFDGRYLWAAGDLGSEWVDFDPIDLTGLRLAVGINMVF